MKYFPRNIGPIWCRLAVIRAEIWRGVREKDLHHPVLSLQCCRSEYHLGGKHQSCLKDETFYLDHFNVHYWISSLQELLSLANLIDPTAEMMRAKWSKPSWSNSDERMSQVSVAVVGNSRCGKTQLINRFMSGTFTEVNISNISWWYSELCSLTDTRCFIW